jgi:hypothetical protein
LQNPSTIVRIIFSVLESGRWGVRMLVNGSSPQCCPTAGV